MLFLKTTTYPRCFKKNLHTTINLINTIYGSVMFSLVKTSRGHTMKANRKILMSMVLIFIVATVTFFLAWIQIYRALNPSLFLSYSFIIGSITVMYQSMHRVTYNVGLQYGSDRYLDDIARLDKAKSEPEVNILARKLSAAIEHDMIDIYFQKIINAQTNKTLYVEQLARWVDDDLGAIDPESMLKIAKSSRQLLRLDRYLINKSVELYKKYCQNSDDTPKLALNLTPETFLHDATLKYLITVLKTHKITINQVCLEIAETTFMNDHEECIESINNYKTHGFAIALDDFGKSYSSLGILENIDYDVIKIDRLFTKTIDREKTQEIVKMIQKITAMSFKTLVIEGVENTTQKKHLEALKCTNFQGFLFHRPEKF